MNQISLDVQSKPKVSKNGNRRLRRAGRLPAVIYGGVGESVAITLDSVKFHKMLNTIKRSTVFNLEIDGTKTQTMIREWQRDPVAHRSILHVDFYRIQADKAVDVEVPVHAVGLAAGTKLGGVLETQLRRVLIRCLPLEVPEAFEIDVSALEIGDSLHVSDLSVPENTEILSDKDQPLFNVAGRMAEEEVEEVEEGVEGAEAAEGAEGAEAATEESTDEAKESEKAKS